MKKPLPEIVYTDHVNERSNERNIPINIIEKAIKGTEFYKRNAFSENLKYSVLAKIENGTIDIKMSLKENKLVVITAYWTKEEKKNVKITKHKPK